MEEDVKSEHCQVCGKKLLTMQSYSPDGPYQPISLGVIKLTSFRMSPPTRWHKISMSSICHTCSAEIGDIILGLQKLKRGQNGS